MLKLFASIANRPHRRHALYVRAYGAIMQCLDRATVTRLPFFTACRVESDCVSFVAFVRADGSRF